MPHLCVDALEIGTQVVNALQRIVSRHTNPLESAVLSVCRFQSGTAFNVIPGEAILSSTTRTFSKTIWEILGRAHPSHPARNLRVYGSRL